MMIFATNNRHKLEEASAILGIALSTPADMGITDEIPEEQDTLEGNALQKARYIHERTGMDCFADDTGLEVDALGGAPGVHSARYAGDNHDSAANLRLLMERMEGKTNRRARFRTVVALILRGEEYLFEGQVCGTISDTPSGGGGFGYDPVFIPDGYDHSFAEMDAWQKNTISHRGAAMRKLADFLRENL